jgi:hypothetical protein
LVQYPGRDVLTKSFRASRSQASHVDAIGGIDCRGVAGGNARPHANNFNLLLCFPAWKVLTLGLLIVSEPRADKVLVSRRQPFVIVRLNDSCHIRLGRYHIITEKLRPKFLSGKILNPLNQLWFKSGGLIRGDDVDATEPQTL